jgi:glucose/arabinose dehydrogenase
MHRSRRRIAPARAARTARSALALSGALALGASAWGHCSEHSKLPPGADTGPTPTLVLPNTHLIPTVEIAPALGWPAGGHPTAPGGHSVTPFATGLDHPRWLLVLPNGDVLVAETNAPPKPDDRKGLKGAYMKHVQKEAGAGTKSADRITLLRDTNHDGVADVRTTFLDGLHSPFGMALVGNVLYIADTDALLRVGYVPGSTHASGTPVKVADLPAGTINHHWTKNVIASPDGRKLYVTVGSNSNVGDNGEAAEQGRARVDEVDPATGAIHPFATGVRNPNGLAWNPDSGALWVVANERDELGSDLVPDYLTSLKPGAFYGWPYSWYGDHPDIRPKPPHPELVQRAIAPDYALGSHVAALGLAWSGAGSGMAAPWAHGMFVGEHGSWNRCPRSGYKVVYVPFEGTAPSGLPQDVLTGFLSPDGKAFGRPVGVAVDGHGGLLVADDVGNAVWRVALGAH